MPVSDQRQRGTDHRLVKNERVADKIKDDRETLPFSRSQERTSGGVIQASTGRIVRRIYIEQVTWTEAERGPALRGYQLPPVLDHDLEAGRMQEICETEQHRAAADRPPYPRPAQLPGHQAEPIECAVSDEDRLDSDVGSLGGGTIPQGNSQRIDTLARCIVIVSITAKQF